MPKPTTNERRLAKYRRKKLMAYRSRNPERERYALLYWRYWFKVYERHQCLWDCN